LPLIPVIISALCVAHNATVNTCLLGAAENKYTKTQYQSNLCAPHSAPLLEVLLLPGNFCFTAKAYSSFFLICFTFYKNWESGGKNSTAVPGMCALTFLLVTSKAMSFSGCIKCVTNQLRSHRRNWEACCQLQWAQG